MRAPPDHLATNDSLWDRWQSAADQAARDELIRRHLGLVHHVARTLAARAAQADPEDLASAGAVGLLRALETFDRSRGLAFSTYAVQRIRGAILDDLRSRDWIPRSIRARGRQLATASQLLRQRLGRPPAPSEIATALAVDGATYWRWRAAVDGGIVVPLDARRPGGHRLEETLPDVDGERADAALEREAEAAELRAALDRLPERERTVLSLYYFEELNLRQIAGVLRVTESRVSQIRSRALGRLRERMLEARAA